MKKVVLFLACALALSAFGADGAAVYKKCIACHGVKAEKVYLNKVPALNGIDSAKMVEDMKKFKAGEVNGGKGYFGMGAVMKLQMSKLSEDDMKAVADYIKTLK